MRDNGWKFVNGAMLPTCLPLEEADTTILKDKNLWRRPLWKKAYFARYTTQVGQGNGEWYWVIKDTPLDLDSIKGKYRYEIKKGIAFFRIEVIKPLEYEDALYEVMVNAYASYPKIYRFIPTREAFLKSLPTWKTPCFAAFHRESGKLCGYINIVEREHIVFYSGQAVLKEFERHYINAALVYGMLCYYKEQLEKKQVVIVDGEKNILHKTAHQEFLVKKLGFRKVPCILKVVYRPIIKTLVFLLFPLRKLLLRFDEKSKLIHKINGVLEMERVVRLQKGCAKKE